MRRLTGFTLAVALIAGACGSTAETTTTAPPTTAAPATTAAPTTTAPPSTTEQPPRETIDTGPVAAVADGIGDPYYPELGNTGYDVDHYTLELEFDPDTDTLTGLVTIEATATQDLPSLNLDFIGFTISELIVDGVPAEFGRSEQELTIRPLNPIAGGEAFTVSVSYEGTPRPLDSAAISFGVGWSTSPSGQRYVVAEPDGARSWFPANDHPLDKATFTFLVTVPDPLLAAANGILVDTDTDQGRTTYVWEMDDLMAPYLATVVIGEYNIVEDLESSALSGVRIRNVLPDDQIPTPPPVLRQGEMIEFFSELFGPFPFETYGIAVVDGFPAALENQTLSIFGDRLVTEPVLVHELAHQWFGDYVSTARWQDIWLNEGFASYAEWLWLEHTLGTEALAVGLTGERERFAAANFPPPGLPPSDDLFNASVYRIGAMTLHALRLTVGDDAFFTTLRTYVDRFGGATASTEDFIAVAQEVSGQDLGALFDAWLYGAAVPEFPLD